MNYKFYGPFENGNGVTFKLNKGKDRYTIEFSNDELLAFGIKASSQVAKDRFKIMLPDYEENV